MYSCVGLLPRLWYGDDVSPHLPLDFFPSQKAFFQRPFRSLDPLFLLFSLHPDIYYQVSRTALAFYSGSVAPHVCRLSSFHQWIQPVLPPVFCPNTSCHSSIMTAAFFHVSFYFWLHSVLWSNQCESTCPFFDPSVFPGSVLTYLCYMGSQFTSFVSLPKALFTSYKSPGSQLQL